jgi:hypothetical protein
MKEMVTETPSKVTEENITSILSSAKLELELETKTGGSSLYIAVVH